MNELTLAVVGIDYPNADKSRSNRRFELLQCLPGEPVELRHEPRNRHDPHAVAVFSARGVQIGYLSAERAPWILRRMDHEEMAAVFQQLAASVAYIRVRFGGGQPTLPPSANPRRDEGGRGIVRDGDFYPDPDGPDWGA